MCLPGRQHGRVVLRTGALQDHVEQVHGLGRRAVHGDGGPLPQKTRSFRQDMDGRTPQVDTLLWSTVAGSLDFPGPAHNDSVKSLSLK
jgi:hypothetical protein